MVCYWFAEAPHRIACAELANHRPLSRRPKITRYDFFIEIHLRERFRSVKIWFWIFCCIGKSEIRIAKSQPGFPNRKHNKREARHTVLKLFLKDPVQLRVRFINGSTQDHQTSGKENKIDYTQSFTGSASPQTPTFCAERENKVNGKMVG